MLNWEEKMDILSLYKDHKSIRKVSSLTGVSRNTISRIIKNEHAPKGNKKERNSKLSSFFDYVEKRYDEGLSAHLIFQELLSLEYKGSYDVVQRYVKKLKEKEVANLKATVRFETRPGYQSQVDWGYCGHSIDKDGKRKPIYVFAYLLSYSRFCYIEFTSSMKLDVLIKCHQNAFDYSGGVPSQILFDNMKQVRLAPDKLQPCFEDFSHCYGFDIKTCRPYRARTKGKVERLINYVKKNFLPGKNFSSLEDANGQARHWMSNTANNRIHGTTGKIPSKELPLEKLISHTLLKPFMLTRRVERKVTSDGLVNLDGSKYTVPPETVTKVVTVEHFNQVVRIFNGNTLLIEHPYSNEKGKTIAKKEHIEEMWKRTVGTVSQRRCYAIHEFKGDVYERSLSEYEEIAQ